MRFWRGVFLLVLSTALALVSRVIQKNVTEFTDNAGSHQPLFQILSRGEKNWTERPFFGGNAKQICGKSQDFFPQGGIFSQFAGEFSENFCAEISS